MAGILTLSDLLSLDEVRKHWRFSVARFKSDTNAASYVAGLQAFGALWTPTKQKEMDLDDAVTDAEAGAVASDGELDTLTDQIVAGIHGGKKVNVNAPLHVLFFGAVAPSLFKRPTLGSQLDKAQSWPTQLSSATVPALQALAARATTVVQAGNTAAAALHDAIVARDTFRLGGERKKAIDSLNASFAAAYGGLKAFAHAHPELGLPSDYAESFFMKSAASPHGESITESAAQLAASQKQTAALQKRHDDLVARSAAKSAAAAEHQKAKEAAATAKQAARDAAKLAKAAALAAKKR